MSARLLLNCSIFIHYAISSVSTNNPLLVAAEDAVETAETAKCVLQLSAKYFVDEKALSGSIVVININARVSTEKVLLETIHGGMKYSVMVKDSFYHHANASHFPEKAKNYMMILEKKSELTRNILQLNRLPTWNPLAKAVVFYELKANESGEKMAIKFINKLRDYKLLRSIILIYSPEIDAVVSYTWRPYDDKNCGGICESVYILDKCQDDDCIIEEYNKEVNMFPLDLKGCPLVVYAVVSEPNVMPPVRKLTNMPFDDVYEFEEGSEVNLVKIISEFTNTTLIMRMSETPENWGTVYPNGTATGAYGMLTNDSADFVIGNIEVTRMLRKWFDPTVSYSQDEMTWCVPKAGQASTWDNLVIIFQKPTWLAVNASLVITACIFHYFYYKEQGRKVVKWPTKSLLMTFSMLLGWGSLFKPKKAAFRILIFAWLCFSLIMSITYQSFLRSFLMHPRFERQISNEEELIQSRIPLGGREIYRSYFETNNASSFYFYRKYNSTTFAEGIRRVALNRNFAIVASRRQAEYHDQKLGKGAPLIYCFPERNNLYKYDVILLARKWFPMMDRFNKIIRNLRENGLIFKWRMELFIHSVSVQGTSSAVPLTIQHLLGAFILIGIMYVCSMVVFICEVCYGLIEKRRMARKLVLKTKKYKKVRF